MSRARPRRGIEQCPECRTWWRTWLWQRHGEWQMYCGICGEVRWRAVVRLTDLARLTAVQRKAYQRSLETENAER